MTGPNISKAKLEPDVIDNRAISMADTLNINLPRIPFLYVSSGYFEVSGYRMVRRALEKAAADPNFKFRLMVGSDALRTPAYDTFEKYRDRITESPATLQTDLERQSLDDSGMDDVAGLMVILRQDNVQVRRSSARFNHAKCYIMGIEGAIVGSSNFTKSGLSGNDELNAGIYVTGTWEKIKKWYDRMWGKAEDAKEDMMQVLAQSKFGVPAEPHDVYLKMLFEKYRHILDAMEGGAVTTKKLAKFQQDAVATILQTIENMDGAVLADSTGLGKTHIGLEVMHKKMVEGKRVLLIAPAQVRDTVWRAKLEEAQINARTIGTEELGRKTFDISKYKRYDFVIIDESQNFRSGTANRYRNLMKMTAMGRRKQFLLMSATPVNNTLMDLYYQISIITGGRDDRFADIGIPNLYQYMRKAANHRLNDGLERIQLLLDTIMVRRTRTFIREVYPDGRIGDNPITFPRRNYKPIRYGMTDRFGNIYRDLLETINSLHMAPYGIERYNRTLTEEEKRKHAVLAHLQVILLLKRFESSVNAVTISIKNKIKLFEYFGNLLKQDKIVPPKQLNRIMARWNAQGTEGDTEESREEFFMNEIRELPVQDTADYDTDTMTGHIESDLVHLRRYHASLKEMSGFDMKAEAVAEMMRQDGAMESEGRKALVFTEYMATATYVRDFLREKFPDKRVDLITGSVKKSHRADIIRRFSPRANMEEDGTMPDVETDILVSTEVLAEGQNLQDCNYVVNYDLPWNPMRIVQRIGRVDRLTSTYDTVRSRECFPDEKLDELLTLVGKLMDKIVDINDTVGLDADLLGQEASPKNFKATDVGRIRALAGGAGTSVTEEMERESDLMPMMSPLNEISRHIRQAGIEKMKEFSMGRRSGKAGEGRKAVLGYVRETPSRRFYSAVYEYATGRAEVVDDMEAMLLARCPEGESIHLPMDGASHAESFRHLLMIDGKARRAIEMRNDRDHAIVRDMRSRPKKAEKTIEKIRNIVYESIEEGRLPMEDGEAADVVLDSADLRHWGEELEGILTGYGGDICDLVTQVKRLGDMMGITETEVPERPVQEPPGSLTLAGVMFIGDVGAWPDGVQEQ